ncbi:MAG: hypothetical protein KC505_08660 [Myxococcales bacterium]|nr:hypothetical protein [Myxococcales bacterium]USN51628.1 MAG: hypothetical protein H6731_04250 [Myxococcales bacterium]
MNKMLRAILLFSIGFFCFQAMTQSFFEDEFKRINRIIINTFSPKVAKKNAEIELKEIYEGYGGAFKVDSVRKPLGENRYIVTLTGEGAENANTLAIRALFACHEMGHILGGAPFQSKRLADWSSVEGQADYWGASECMWLYINNEQSRVVIHSYEEEQIKACKEHYESEKDQLGCLRILSSIDALVAHWNLNREEDKKLSLFDTDPTVVTKTLEKHPPKACRIQTMVNGALGMERPTCWFKS